jgi:hypothetical protein
MRWIETDKGDPRCRELADRHYTRGKPGHPMWTRPGWNQVLYTEQRDRPQRTASFCWFRPKWESGILGTERKDKLRAIECAIFRNETRFRSSKLIIEAIAALLTWEHALDVEWPDGIITGIGSEQTKGGRRADHDPGWCFREAGFVPFDHAKGRADVWLKYAGPLPVPCAPERSARMLARLAA